MAVGTTTAILGGVSVGLSALQAAKSAKDKKKAIRDLENYERQDISPGSSPYNNMQISTLGSDLMREESARSAATAYDVLGQAGDRAILGGIGKVGSLSNQANREAQLYLDQQAQERAKLIAQDETAMRAMRENRDMQNIAALGSQVQSSEQAFQSGIMGMASGAMGTMRGLQTDKAFEIAKANKDSKGIISDMLGGSSRSYVPPISNSDATSYNGMAGWMNPHSAFSKMYGRYKLR